MRTGLEESLAEAGWTVFSADRELAAAVDEAVSAAGLLSFKVVLLPAGFAVEGAAAAGPAETPLPIAPAVGTAGVQPFPGKE